MELYKSRQSLLIDQRDGRLNRGHAIERKYLKPSPSTILKGSSSIIIIRTNAFLTASLSNTQVDKFVVSWLTFTNVNFDCFELEVLPRGLFRHAFKWLFKFFVELEVDSIV
ncbi:hypothetical protein V6Z11_D11G233000 [Gossypium hirsutum]